MLIAVDERCPIFSEESKIHLSRLLHAVVAGRHIIVSPALERLRAIMPTSLWAIYGDALVQGFKKLIDKRGRIHRHIDCKQCDPACLATYYNLPLAIIVENATNDGRWLRMVAQHFRPALKRHFRGPDSHIRIYHAGGIGEIPKELQRISEEYEKVRPTGLPLRVIAIADSDAKSPGKPSVAAHNVEKAATQLQTVAHVLSKRTIENYIPDKAIDEYCRTRTDRRPASAVIAVLTRPARDHYPMKSGLDEWDKVGNDLFADVPLGLGMGDFIADLLTNFYYSIEIHDLKARDGCGELPQLMDLLEGIL